MVLSAPYNAVCIFSTIVFFSILSSAQSALSGTDMGCSVTTSGAGSVYLSGNFESRYGAFDKANRGGRDVFFLKMDAQGNLLWTITLGGSRDEFSNSTAREFSDGSQIWLVNSMSRDYDFPGNKGNLDIWVIKVSPTGGIVWKRHFGGSVWDYGTAVTVTRDDGFLLSGITKSKDGDFMGMNDAGGTGYVFKCDKNGNPEWKKFYRGAGYDEVYYCEQTKSGDFLLLLKTNSRDLPGTNPLADGNLVAILLGADGAEKKRVCLSQHGYTSAHNWCESDDGSFLFAGQFMKIDTFSSNIRNGYWYARTDSLLKIQWEKRVLAPQHGQFESIVPLDDQSGFLAVGADAHWTMRDDSLEKNPYAPQPDAVVAKINQDGSIAWAKYLPGSSVENFFNMAKTPDGGVVTAGWTQSTDGFFDSRRNTSFDALIVKFSPAGDLQWRRTFGGWNDEQVVGYSKKAFVIRAGSAEPGFIRYFDFLLGILTALLIGLLFSYIKFRKTSKERLVTLRANVARDLHDEVGATMGSIALFGKSLQKMLGEARPDAQAGLQKITESAEKSLETIRDIVWTIDTSNDLASDLVARAREFALPLAELASVDCSITARLPTSDQQLSAELKKNLWLIFKEGVSNALRYSGARALGVEFVFEKEEIRLEMRDDGCGFDTNVPGRTGNGLRNMQRRAAEIGGKLDIVSAPGAGTLIKLKCSAKGV